MLKSMGKSAKLLGLDMKTMATSTLSGDGHVSLVEWLQFWQAAASAKAGVDFLLILLDKMVHYKPGVDDRSLPPELLTSTVMFVALFLDRSMTHTNKKLAAWANAKWQGATRSQFEASFPSAAAAVSLLLLDKGDEQGMDKVENAVISMLGQTSAQGHAAFVAHGDKATTDFNLAHVWPFLMRRVRDEDRRRQLAIMSKVLTSLETISGDKSQRATLDFARARFIIVERAHMLMRLMEMSPVPPTEEGRAFLDRSARAWAPVFLWSNPHGAIARDMLTAIEEERRSPGVHMRRAFAREANTGMNANYADELGQESRPLHYFVGRSGEEWSFAARMSLVAYKDVEPKAPTTRGKASPSTELLLANAILKATVGVADSEASMLRGLGKESASRLWAAVESVLDGTEGDDERRNTGLDGVKNGLLVELASADGGAAPVLPEDAQCDDRDPDSLPPPKLPPVAHLNMRLVGDKDEPYSITDRDQAALMNVKVMPFPTTPFHDVLERLITEQHRVVGGAEPVTVRLVIAGGNTAVHQFACAYAEVMRNVDPERLAGIDIRVFVVPFTKNHLSSFVAKHDPLYYRTVYQPFRSVCFVAPAVAHKSATMSHPDGTPIDPSSRTKAVAVDPEDLRLRFEPKFPPVSVMRDCVETYVRNATRTLPLHLFRITCFCNSQLPSGSLPDAEIPLSQRLEIGLVPTARHYQKQINAPENMTFQELLAHKGFDYVPPVVRVSYSKVDLDGRPQGLVRDDPMPITSILVSNVPRRGDSCVAADPSKAFLEMFVRLDTKSEASKAIARHSKSNTLSVEPKQHVSRITVVAEEADQFLEDHELSVEDVSSAAGFHIRVDGVNFGPYEKIVVEQLMDRDGANGVTLPIQVFQDIDPGAI